MQLELDFAREICFAHSQCTSDYDIAAIDRVIDRNYHQVKDQLLNDFNGNRVAFAVSLRFWALALATSQPPAAASSDFSIFYKEAITLHPKTYRLLRAHNSS